MSALENKIKKWKDLLYNNSESNDIDEDIEVDDINYINEVNNLKFSIENKEVKNNNTIDDITKKTKIEQNLEGESDNKAESDERKEKITYIISNLISILSSLKENKQSTISNQVPTQSDKSSQSEIEIISNIIQMMKDVSSLFHSYSYSLNQKLKKTFDEKSILNSKSVSLERIIKEFEVRLNIKDKEYQTLKEKYDSVLHIKSDYDERLFELQNLNKVNVVLSNQINELKERHVFVIEKFYMEMNIVEEKIKNYEREIENLKKCVNDIVLDAHENN